MPKEGSWEKHLSKKAEYLAGKPIRVNWWVLLLHMLLWIAVAGVIYGPLIYRGIREGIPFEIPILQIGTLAPPWDFLLLIVFFLTMLHLAIQMSRMVVLKKDGLFYRDALRRKHKIPYADITSYAFYKGRRTGIAVETSDKKYFFHSNLVGYEYLCEEIILKVGEDKKVERNLWD